MGIYINLDIKPNSITKEEWNDVYNEAVILLNKYPFMDIERKKIGDITIPIVTRARELYDEEKNSKYFRVMGDMKSQKRAESFYLYNEMKCLNERAVDSGDIIKDYLANNEEEIYSVFDSKTQGEDYHSYVLAIAALIESRFKDRALVHGDVREEQAEMAIEFANKHLKEKINIPVVLDAKALMGRLRKIYNDEAAVLNSFLNLYRGYDATFVVREYFSEKVIIDNYIAKVNEYSELSMLGAKEELVELFNFKCDKEILKYVVNKLSNKNTPYNIIETLSRINLFNSVIHENVKETGEYFNSPGNVQGQMAKMLFSIKYGPLNLSSNIPLSDIEDYLKDELNFTLDEVNEIKEIVKLREKQMDEVSEMMKKLHDFADKEMDKINKGTININQMEDLYLWRKDVNVKEDIKEYLHKIKEFINEVDCEEVNLSSIMGWQEAMARAVRRQNIVLFENIWEYLNSIEDIGKKKKAIRLFNIKMNSTVSKLYNAIERNEGLCRFLIE